MSVPAKRPIHRNIRQNYRYKQVEANVLKLLREYRDNLQFLTEAEQKIIKPVVDNQKMPQELPSGFVSAVNNLLKGVDVIEISDEDLLSALFPDKQMDSLEELRQGFVAFENGIKQNKDESEIRIKLR